jgi:hypothetical protein
MDAFSAECLCCGHSRQILPSLSHAEDAGECPRCHYVGWAYSSELSERARRLFRELPLERRLRIHSV